MSEFFAEDKQAKLDRLYQQYLDASRGSETTVEELPTMDPPGDDAGAHLVLRNDPEAGTLCGAVRNHRDCGDWDENFTCSCGTPVCPTCRDLAIALVRYGGRLP